MRGGGRGDCLMRGGEGRGGGYCLVNDEGGGGDCLMRGGEVIA